MFINPAIVEGKNINFKKSILYTLHFFGLMGKPLNLFELWENLYCFNQVKMRGLEIIDLQNVLDEMPEIESQWGFYFLKGKAKLVKKRWQLYNFSQVKWKRARRISRLLSILPFVRMIAVVNTVAFNVAKSESDIDLFFITRAKRIWTARFLITAAVSILGLRRHANKVKNRLCLSFYLTDQNLDLARIALKDKNGDLNDPYLAYWLNWVSPIYDDGVGIKFFANNSWMKRYILKPKHYQGTERRIIKLNFFWKTEKRILEFLTRGAIGDQIEYFLKKVQKKKMAWNTKSVAKENNTKVVISDQMLKFHEKDRRQFFKEKLALLT